MKQITENLKDGVVKVVNTPIPSCGSSELIIRNKISLISPGTEKLMIELGMKNMAGKAISRPDLVRAAFAKAKREGFFNVYKEVLARLEQPLPLGYSSAGIVEAIGSNVKGFSVGNAVACSGAGFASHADFIAVPPDLVVKLNRRNGKPIIPFEHASFVMLGGIALQGFRCAQNTHGEFVVVIGLGLIGLLTLQIADAYGCKTIGVDIDNQKVTLARKIGIKNVFSLNDSEIEQTILNLTQGVGADSVIIAAATADNSPIILAEKIARKRGRIVLLGVCDITLTRKAFWDKELTFTVSKASGPSSDGSNFSPFLPIELVRWSEKRNLEEFLRLVENGRIKIEPLISHKFKIKDAAQAYELILKAKAPYIGILIQYPDDAHAENKIINDTWKNKKNSADNLQIRSNVGLIGAGMFTRNVFLPAAQKTNLFRFIGVAAKSGLNSTHVAKTFNFQYTTTDYQALLQDKSIGSVFITTRHNLHGSMVLEALKAGKHVFVEKPLAICEDDLDLIVKTFNQTKSQLLMVGFNRRYAPLARKLSSAFSDRSAPMQILFRVNAGYIPEDHWTQDRKIGGGRIIGEVCHFIDFCQYLSKACPIEVCTTSIGGSFGKYFEHDNVQISIRFDDGSLATIIYTSLGSKLYSRERVEVFCGDSVGVLEDFKSLQIIKSGKKETRTLWNQDMGYREELNHFLTVPLPDSHSMFLESIYTTKATFAAMKSLAIGKPVLIEGY